MEKILLSAALKKTVSELYDFSKNIINQKAVKLINDNKINTMIRHIDNVGMVRTLWQIDKRVHLEKFFCHPHILMGKGSKTLLSEKKERKKFTDMGCLSYWGNTNFVIQGIAGQGKSILLRYICITELKKSNRIPIFVELRRISNQTSLRSCIIQEIKNIGLLINEKLFETYAASGKLLLLLDGFDETQQEHRQEIVNDLEIYSQQFPAMQILVTTRPNLTSGIEVSTQFENLSLDTIEGNEYKDYIEKLIDNDDPELKKSLFHQLENKPSIKSLLKTPLMITIMLVTYKSHQYIPSSLSRFYEELFPVLYQRHDGTKPGYKRQRSSRLDQYQAQDVMSAFCLISKEYKYSGYTDDDFYLIAKNAIQLSELVENATPESFKNDISQITGLILREGRELRFIHKSIQEYFCARMINIMGKKRLKRYVEMKIIPDINSYSKELEFLTEINPLRLLKHIIQPSIMSLNENLHIVDLLAGYKLWFQKNTDHVSNIRILGEDIFDRELNTLANKFKNSLEIIRLYFGVSELLGLTLTDETKGLQHDEIGLYSDFTAIRQNVAMYQYNIDYYRKELIYNEKNFENSKTNRIPEKKRLQTALQESIEGFENNNDFGEMKHLRETNKMDCIVKTVNRIKDHAIDVIRRKIECLDNPDALDFLFS